MHLLLTDRLVCPRCGPAFGLILRADRLEERRVHRGGLGCPNCRETYPVVEGLADLRPPPRTADDAPRLGEPAEDRLALIHALLGITEGPAQVAALGSAARFAPGLARRIPEVEVAAVHGGTAAWPESSGVSRFRSGPSLPFAPRGFAGVVLEAPGGREDLREGARILGGSGRIVVVEASGDSAGHLLAAGLTVRAEEDGVVVATR